MQTYDNYSSTRNLKKVFTFFIFYSIIIIQIVGDDRMKRIYTSVDLGSDTIKIVVAEFYQGKINLLASTAYKSKGIKKGLITDVELATESVKNAIREIETILSASLIISMLSLT